MTVVLCAIFFLSGASALIFENLWFHQAGLTFGNSVWASSLVLAGFMAGLAIGNLLVARQGVRVLRPVRFYAWIELAIAVSGVALVYGLPSLTPALAGLFGPVLETPWANPLRLVSGFLLLLIPSTAMGATLPLLVKALLARDPNFGAVLGRLYGWNTAGAVVGAVAPEAGLVAAFGITGTAWVAASINGLVALIAIGLGRRLAASPSTPRPPALFGGLSARGYALLAGAFGSGFTLLALEVVWFRFLQLFIHATTLVFATMLAIVLLGIALGGFVAGAWLRRSADAVRHTPLLALLAGVLVVALYAGVALHDFDAAYILGAGGVLRFGLPLMLPVALLSGILFTTFGTALEREVAPPTRAAGLTTFANTVGSGIGSLVAGFVLLPWLGMERSFFVLACSYAGVALLALAAVAPGPEGAARRFGRPALGFVALLVALALFPFGFMNERYVMQVVERYRQGGARHLELVREGRTETSVLLRADFLGGPFAHWLVTNGHGMSSTEMLGRRYMKFYAYWPFALHPEPRRALLISYGLGNTARALLDEPKLEQLDIVDISRDILDISDVIYREKGTHPLRDPRTRVHVEDGRYYLQTTRERFDLITGEPPPPKNAGIVNLYTREYFQLVYDRLAEGGINTYWLPVHNLTAADTRAIVRAYCDVFADCSLWAGTAVDWMLVGSREAQWTGSEALFRRQWSNPQVRDELLATGFERPEQLGTTFIADADQIAAWVADTPPLVDDFPKRLATEAPFPRDVWPDHAPWVDANATRERFAESRFIAEAWPPALREGTLEHFRFQAILSEVLLPPTLQRQGSRWRIESLDLLLEESELETLVLWALGSRAGKAERAVEARGRLAQTEAALRHRAFAALAARDYEEAARLLRRVTKTAPGQLLPIRLYLYALCKAGRVTEAESQVQRLTGRLPAREDRGYWEWMSERFGLSSPFVAEAGRGGPVSETAAAAAAEAG